MVSLHSFIATALTAVAVSGQGTEQFTDSKTGVAYQRFLKGQYSFGITLPTAEDADEFTAQLTGPVVGWAGVSLAGQMKGSLLITAWANGKDVVTGFRYADGYSIPAVYNQTGPTLTQIPCRTFVNTTHFTVTFQCKKCNTWTSLNGLEAGFPLTNDVSIFGYASSTQPVADPSDMGSDFSIHTNFGQYAAQIGKARNAQYNSQAGCGGSGSGGEGETEEKPVLVVSTRKPTAKPTTKKASSDAGPTEPAVTSEEPVEEPTAETSSQTVMETSPVVTAPATSSKWRPTVVRPTFTKTAKPTIVKPTKTSVQSTASQIVDPPPITDTPTPTPTLDDGNDETSEPTGTVIDEPTGTVIDEPTSTIIDEPTQAPTTKPSHEIPKAKHWQQCGGITYKGPTKCTWPWRCKKMNDYYHQCV